MCLPIVSFAVDGFTHGSEISEMSTASSEQAWKYSFVIHQLNQDGLPSDEVVVGRFGCDLRNLRCIELNISISSTSSCFLGSRQSKFGYSSELTEEST